MTRSIGLVVIALALALVTPSHAGEWRDQSHEESIIAFHSDWDWAAPEKGEYTETWTNNFSSQLSNAAWGNWPAPRLQIMVERLGPGRIWARAALPLDEDYLEFWYELRDASVSNLEKIPCDARQCVTFKVDGIYNCGAIANYPRSREVWQQSWSMDNADEMGAYVCIGTTTQVTAEILNKILASIVIKANKYKIKSSGSGDSSAGSIKWGQ